MNRRNSPLMSKKLLPSLFMAGGALMFAGVLLLLAHPLPAQANTGDLAWAEARYPNMVGSRIDTCSLCHTASIPMLNPYGAAYKAAGRSQAALVAIEPLDSDGDGFTNLQEFQALTFPGNPSDHPAVAPTATATRTSLPPTSTPTKIPTLPPTSAPTATALPTSTPVSLPTNTPTSAPTSTVAPTLAPTYPPAATATALAPSATATNLPPTAVPTLPGSSPTPTITPTQPVATPTQPLPTPVGTPQPPSPVQGVLSLAPAADDYVSASAPTANYGTALSLRAIGKPEARGYLRFTLPALPAGARIQRATLSLYVNSASGTGFTVNQVGDTTWSESQLDFANAPTPGPMIASSARRVPTGHWITVDLASLVQANGSVSLALLARGDSWNTFASRESVDHAPVLKLYLAQGGERDEDDHVGRGEG